MTSSERTTNRFVGRRQELAVLTAALDDTLSGRGQLAMLAGEPGIGKTRLAHELVVLAEAQNAIVLQGWCHERRGAPPYWPWLQSIRAYIETTETSQLRQDMGPGAADISEILPELTLRLEGLEKPSALDREQARFRLFFSITNFLKNVGRRQPLVMVLDDLHWADESSLLLLEFLAREISASSLMVVGTYRDVEVTGNHLLAETLGSLVREENFHRIQIGGLNRREVAEFVEIRAGIAIADATVASLHQRTQGNPLFVGEVVSSASPEEIGRDQAWMTGIPEAVREAISRRVSRLSETCNQILRTASVIGRDFDLPLLRTLCPDISEDEFLSGLDEAISIRIVEPMPAGLGGYRFGHALIQQSVYEEIPPMRRSQTHALVGEKLEELHQRDLDQHAGELAHHFTEAGLAQRAAGFWLRAGEAALVTYAHEEAVGFFTQGLGAKGLEIEGSKSPEDEDGAALLFGLARAQAATFERHQLGEVFGTLRRAFEYYADVDNIALAVAAAEFPMAPAGVLIPGVSQLMARALTLVPTDSHEAGRLLSRYGGILGAAEGDYEGAQQALGQAIVIARRERDVPLELQTLTNACDVSGRNLNWQESVDNGVRAIELLTGDENPYFEVLSRYFTALSYILMGDPDAARPHAVALRDLTERRVTGVLSSLSFGPTIYLACLLGNWNAAREHSDRSLEVAPLDPLLLLPRVLLEHETGESAQGEVYLEKLLEAMRRSVQGQVRASGRVSLAIATIARITGVTGRLKIAEEAAQWILSRESLAPQDAMHAKAGLALLAVQEDDQTAAAELHAFLLGQRRTMTSSVASVDRLLGLLSKTIGDLDQAAAHFEDALVICRKAGYRPELAWTCCDYADTLLERNRNDDGATMKSMLEESLSISTDLGMLPLMQRVAARQQLAESQPLRKPAYPHGLTQREVEVLGLIAAGKTDREIAEELIISTRTVSNHVASILNRTGVANRTEATAYAVRQGLV